MISKIAIIRTSQFWGKISVVITVLLLFLGFFAPFVSIYDYFEDVNLDHLFLPPLTNGHLLGTNEFGRDILSGLFYGLRTSFMVGGISSLLALFFGSFIGVLSAYKGGWVDGFWGRIIELHLSLPSFLLALLLVAFIGHGLLPLIVAIFFGQWAYFAQAARSIAKSEIKLDYVSSAQMLDLSSFKIVIKHLMPNCVPPLFVILSYQLARAIALESALSFLGVGVPLTTPSLGLFIAQGYGYFLNKAYWISFFPGLLLIVLLMAVTVTGDYLNQLLDPKFRR